MYQFNIIYQSDSLKEASIFVARECAHIFHTTIIDRIPTFNDFTHEEMQDSISQLEHGQSLCFVCKEFNEELFISRI